MTPFRCHDGFCGAEDCERCHPEAFVEGGEFYDEVFDEPDDLDDYRDRREW